MCGRLSLILAVGMGVVYDYVCELLWDIATAPDLICLQGLGASLDVRDDLLPHSGRPQRLLHLDI